MKTTISNLIRNYSFNQVESMLYNGQIGQLTFEAYCRVWEWIAPRFGGIPGWKQDCYWKTQGKDRFVAKINRVRIAFDFEPIKL